MANPVRLEVEERPGAVTVRVVGSADRDFAGTFRLQMSGNGNQSTQQGTVNLAAGEEATFSNVTLAGVDRWEAVLQVKSADGAEYEERASAPT